jgi:hypothetical protein
MMDEKETTVYKRALDMAYHLKIKASRAVFGEVRGQWTGQEDRRQQRKQHRRVVLECFSLACFVLPCLKGC